MTIDASGFLSSVFNNRDRWYYVHGYEHPATRCFFTGLAFLKSVGCGQLWHLSSQYNGIVHVFAFVSDITMAPFWILVKWQRSIMDSWIRLWFDGRLHQKTSLSCSTLSLQSNKLFSGRTSEDDKDWSMYFHAFSWLQHDITLSALNSSFWKNLVASLYADVFSLTDGTFDRHFSLLHDIASQLIIPFVRASSCKIYLSIEHRAECSNSAILYICS